MVEILTLFMWLTTGVQRVDLDVAGAVATVEIRLDGETVGELSAAPWSLRYDFGDKLEAHELVAIARDARGRELARASRWINLHIGTADAKLDFETDEHGRPRAAHLAWESIGSREPEAVELTFDGEKIPVRDARHVVLPSYDEGDLHFLSASVRFPGEREIRLNATFGGLYGEELTTELTAVPVVLSEGARLPRPKELGAWLVKGGKPLEVHTVEKGKADVVIVRDPAALPYFEELTRAFIRGQSRSTPRSGQRRRLREAFLFPTGTHTTFLSPFAVPLRREEVTPESFFSSDSRTAGGTGILWLSHHNRLPSPPLQLADAVALAGMDAQAGSRRRAVVLVLAGSGDDRSQHTVAVVREYLRQLRVPLYVWSMQSEAPHPEWGEVSYVGFPAGRNPSTSRLRRTVRDIGQHLGTQRIVWVRGRHLPQDIELSPAARGIRLAGGAP